MHPEPLFSRAFAQRVLDGFRKAGRTTDEMVKAAGGPSSTYMTDLRRAANGDKELGAPRSDTFGRIDAAASWEPGSAMRLWRDGTDPVALGAGPEGDHDGPSFANREKSLHESLSEANENFQSAVSALLRAERELDMLMRFSATRAVLLKQVADAAEQQAAEKGDVLEAGEVLSLDIDEPAAIAVAEATIRSAVAMSRELTRYEVALLEQIYPNSAAAGGEPAVSRATYADLAPARSRVAKMLKAAAAAAAAGEKQPFIRRLLDSDMEEERLRAAAHHEDVTIDDEALETEGGRDS